MKVTMFFNEYESGVDFELTAVPRVGERVDFEITPDYLLQFVPEGQSEDFYLPFLHWKVVQVSHSVEFDEVSVFVSNQ
jgi:hypothetical protein